MNSRPMVLRLASGSVVPSSAPRNSRRSVHVHQRDVVVAAEQIDHGLAFVETQQAVIDEHAGELVADRFVNQHRRDRRVDATGQSADHPALADLPADFLDRFFLEGAHGPVAAAPRDLADEIAQNLRALRRVHHLEVELRGVEPPLLVGDHRDRRIGRGADDAKALRQPGHPVAVAHPDRVLLALLPDALEQRRVLGDQHLGAAKFPVVPGLDLAAELMRHRLLAVADAQHRDARLEQRLRRQRRVLVEHRGGAAGQDHRRGFHRGERLGRLLERHDLAIDLLLAHPPRDELGHLGAEIDDQDLVVRALLGHVRRHLAGIGLAGVRRAQVWAWFWRLLNFGSRRRYPVRKPTGSRLDSGPHRRP